MSPAEPHIPRSWVFEPRGIVQFKKSDQALSWAALQCLGTRLKTRVECDVPPGLVDPRNLEPETLSMNLETGIWRLGKGAERDVQDPKIKPLVMEALEQAENRLNKALSAPLGAHRALSTMVAEYAPGLCMDRPDNSYPIRAWRRADAAWMTERLSASPQSEHAPRDAFDRGFDLIERLDRPVKMAWTYFGRHEGAHHVRLLSPQELCHPTVSLRRQDTRLVMDINACLSGAETQTRILSSQMMALALALRRYAGPSLGVVIISACEVKAFNRPKEARPHLQLQIGANGWMQALGVAARAPVIDLLDAPPADIFFAKVGHMWVKTPFET